MSSNIETKHASLVGPTAAATTGNGATIGVVRLAATTTSDDAALPTVTLGDGRVVVPLQGKHVTIANESSEDTLDFAFGFGSAPTLVAGQLADFTDGDDAAGWQLAPRASMRVVVPTGATHLAWILAADAEASTIALYCSEDVF